MPELQVGPNEASVTAAVTFVTVQFLPSFALLPSPQASPNQIERQSFPWDFSAGIYKGSFLIVFYVLCKLNRLVCFDLDNFICKWLYWFTILVLCNLAPFPLFIAFQMVIADLVEQQLFF